MGAHERRSIGQALRYFLDSRALPGKILHGRVSDEDAILVALLCLTFFLAHWEESVKATPLNPIVMPLDSVPLEWINWFWVPALAIILFNAWFLDHWLATETGGDREWRPGPRWLRAVLAVPPILGLLTICWTRWLIKFRPKWIFFERENTRFSFPEVDALAVKAPAKYRNGRWFDRLHAWLSPSFVFAFSHFVGGMAVLRFLVLEVCRLSVEGKEVALLLSIGVIRLLGLILTLAYLWRWFEVRGRQKWVVLWQLPLALGWFFPERFAYASVFLGICLLDWQLTKWKLSQPGQRRFFSSEVGALQEVGFFWRWSVGKDRSERLGKGEIARRSVARLSTFALVLEIALAKEPVMVLERAFPPLEIPLVVLFFGPLVFFVVLGLIQLPKFIRNTYLFMSGRDSDGEASLRARIRLGTSLAIVFGIGIEVPLFGGERGGSSLWSLFGLLGLILALLFGVRLFVTLITKRRDDSHWARWIVLFMTISAIAGEVEQAPSSRLFLWFLIIASWIFIRILILPKLSFMLHPFRVSDLLAMEVPWTTRLRLVGILAAAIIPFGAFILPNALKSRQKLESEFDELWPFERQRFFFTGPASAR